MAVDVISGFDGEVAGDIGEEKSEGKLEENNFVEMFCWINLNGQKKFINESVFVFKGKLIKQESNDYWLKYYYALISLYLWEYYMYENICDKL